MKKILLTSIISTILTCGLHNSHAEENKAPSLQTSSTTSNTQGLTVNGKIIITPELIAFLDKQLAEAKITDPKRIDEIQKQLNEMAAIIAEAEKTDISNSIGYKAQLYATERTVAIEKLREKILEDAKKAMAKEIAAETEKQLATREYSARHILVKNLAQAKSIIAQLNQGKPFKTLVKKSIEPGATERGGNLGWNVPEVYVPEFGAALKTLKTGAYTKAPVKTQFGYHIILLEDSRPLAKDVAKRNAEEIVLSAVIQQKLQELETKLEDSSIAVTPMPTELVDYVQKDINPKKDPKITEEFTKQATMLERGYQEAKKQGILDTEDYKQQLSFSILKIKAQQYLKNYQTTAEQKIDPAKAKQKYDDMVAEQKKQAISKEYHLRHILVKNKQQAQHIIQQLNKNAKFDELAKKSQDVNTASSGGDLGWIESSNFEPSLQQAITKLEKGKYTQTPVKSNFGWHVLLLEDQRDKPFIAPDFEAFKQQFNQVEVSENTAKHIKELTENAKIEGGLTKPKETPEKVTEETTEKTPTKK